MNKTTTTTTAIPTLLYRLIALSFLLHSVAVQCENKLIISTAKELFEFSESVNNGTTYSGTTVLLVADIDFNTEETFSPIGNNSKATFNGTFDGQGHTISGLKVNASSAQNYIGLFGYVADATIKNVVLDSSCSFSRYSDEFTVYVGGVVAEALADKNDVVIESVVNMGTITYSGDNSDKLLSAGGIVGCVRSNSNLPITAVIRNCANYGSVADTRANSNSDIGGIVGTITGSLNFMVFIQNSVNYGDLKLSGGGGSTSVGGIAGYAQGNKLTSIENCVSAGTVTSANANASTGSIVGNTPSSYNINITNCVWTERANTTNGACGSCSHQKFDIFRASLVEENSTTVATLNNHESTSAEWNKWIFVNDPNTTNITFHINGGKVCFACASHIILLPDPAGGTDRTFSGWFTDSACTTLFTSADNSSVGIDKSTVLYGGWNVSVLFNSTNSNTSVECSSKNVVCGGTYGELPTPIATGFTFCGWSANASCDCEGGSTFVNSSTKVEDHDDHILYACWTPLFNSTLHDVKLEFKEKDLTKDDVKKLIDRHTDDDYEIIEISNDNDGTTIIIRFTDPVNAKNFVDAIKDSSDLSKIRAIGYLNEIIRSCSPSLMHSLLSVLPPILLAL